MSGCRAMSNNAQKMEAVKTLVDLMAEFDRRPGWIENV